MRRQTESRLSHGAFIRLKNPDASKFILNPLVRVGTQASLSTDIILPALLSQECLNL